MSRNLFLGFTDVNGTLLATARIVTLAIVTVALFKDNLMAEFVIHLMTLKTTSHPSSVNPDLC